MDGVWAAHDLPWPSIGTSGSGWRGKPHARPWHVHTLLCRAALLSQADGDDEQGQPPATCEAGACSAGLAGPRRREEAADIGCEALSLAQKCGSKENTCAGPTETVHGVARVLVADWPLALGPWKTCKDAFARCECCTYKRLAGTISHLPQYTPFSFRKMTRLLTRLTGSGPRG